MSYTGIGTSEPNHPLEVKGQVFISNVEQGSTTNLVPFEVYSDYTGITGDILDGGRQLRLRVTPRATTSANVNMDMGIEPTNGDYFYISNAAVNTPLGSNAAFRITQAGDVSMGSNLSVTGSITSSVLNVGNVLDVNESNIIAHENFGIGTTNPQQPLHVVGDALITGTLTTPNIIRSGGLPFTLSSPTLVDPVSSGVLSITGTIASSALDAGTITSSNLSIGDVLYVDGTELTVQQLSSFQENTAILDTRGRLWIKGYNTQGEFGIGYTNPYPTTAYERTALNITDSITRVTMGNLHTMIIAGGKVYGAGSNQYGQLGIGVTGGIRTTFTSNATPVTASEISAGRDHTMIIANGTVSGAGDNSQGQLGIGVTGGTRTTFTANPTPVTASEISCGWDHTMIIANGTVSGTGNNQYGQLGIGSSGFNNRKNTFTQALSVTNASKIDCAMTFGSMIIVDGTVSGTGENTYGQLGIGVTGGTRTTFTQALSVTNASKISCGTFHCMIIDTNGTVSGTGGNSQGQLGIGSTNDKSTFTANPTPVTASEISCGYDYSVISSDTVYQTNGSGAFTNSSFVYGFNFFNKVGIGKINPAYQLELSQNLAAKPNSAFWTAISDRRIKEDIVDADLDTCLENVKNLKLRYYKLRDDIIELDPMFNDSHKLGWIAQEVEEILPKSVTTIPEQYGLTNVKNLDVDQIYVNMFGTIQKLIKKNEDFRDRIEVLKNN